MGGPLGKGTGVKHGFIRNAPRPPPLMLLVPRMLWILRLSLNGMLNVFRDPNLEK